MENKEKILVTSALPYVNNIPHLGNLIGCVLSADVFARFMRSQGHEVLYICGADEHGTATETKAKEEGVTPKQLCDKYFKIHTDIYKWFNISFDHFGRTSLENHHKITQDLFNKVLENGFVKENTITQPFCEKCNTFLADRFVRGTCPHCKYDDAGGDQCDGCGKLLNPDELITPRCKADGSTPIFKETTHLFLELDKLQPKLEKWVKTQSMEGFWTENTVRTTNAWFKEGLKPRAITRDLKYGISIPLTASSSEKSGFKGDYSEKVFYVWFDAPIGYISITEQLTKNWKDWWKNKEVKLYQFMGKDNIPFHSIIFPATLIAANDDFNLVYHINSTEYLNYEKGQFSKSRGTGVFGDNAKESNIPADVFRYYLLYMRPENSDSEFTWKGLQERLNNELLANFGNFINRTLTFISRFFDGNIIGDFEGELSDDLKQFLSTYNYEVDVYKKLMTDVKLREGLQQLMKISALGNALFQDSAPWKKRVDDENGCKADLFVLVNIVKDLAIMCEPFMPSISKEIFSQLNIEPLKLDDVGLLTLQEGKLNEPKVLFKKLEDKEVEELRNKYSGQKKVESKKTTFQDLDLVVGKIIAIKKHPEAEKLYIEKIDLGNEQIQIVSGLVPHYTEEELLNKKIIVVKNLQKAKLRGVESEGMLLAAEQNTESSAGVIGDVEVLSVDEPLGTKIFLENQTSNPKKEISFKEFLEVEIEVKGGFVFCENRKLIANKTFLETDDVDEGRVR